MADTLVFLQMEHRAIARLLSLVEAQCFRVASGAPADHAFLRMLLAYFREYPDACHHPKEDVVFRQLQRRDRDAAAQLTDLLSNHDALGALTREVEELIERASRDGAAGAAGMLAGLQRFVAEYRAHLDIEESSVFPVMAAKLTREDWDSIDSQMFDQPDPLFDESAENRFQLLRERIWNASVD